MTGDVHSDFDVIVLGVGGMGSATCHELAKRGLQVLGLEQFSPSHDLGSSHGESRIIRKAYFEHPDYVPLLHRAYERWHELEQATGRQLFLKTGLVLSGPSDGEAIAGARLSASQHHIPIENIEAADASSRFPGMVFPDDHQIVFEPGAGTLLVEDCVRSHIEQAVRHGATIRFGERVVNWSSDGTAIRVNSTTEQYVASKLVLTAGAWTGECLRELGLPLQVLRKFVGWFTVRGKSYSPDKGFPAYLYELPFGAFYGFPCFDGKSIKVAEHSHGDPVIDPLNVDRNCGPADTCRLNQFLMHHLPLANAELVRHSVCLYTMTPDRHFIVDSHPVWKNVYFAAGFSGHGFKFCSVIGQAMADLAETGSTALPIEFLSLSRPGLSV